MIYVANLCRLKGKYVKYQNLEKKLYKKITNQPTLYVIYNSADSLIYSNSFV